MVSGRLASCSTRTHCVIGDLFVVKIIGLRLVG